MNIMKSLINAHCSHITGWIPKMQVYEELPPNIRKLIPSDVQATIFELKPLFEDLKHMFLEPKEIFRWTSKVWTLFLAHIVSLWKMEPSQ